MGDAFPSVQVGGKVKEFKEAVLASMQRLTAADPAAAAALVIRHFPHDHSRVLTTLEVRLPFRMAESLTRA